MTNIYCVVLLKHTKKTLIVSHKWIKTLVNAEEVDYGAKKSTERKIFYSPELKTANFDLPIQNDFNQQNDGCYIGYLLKSFGKSSREVNEKFSDIF